MQIDLNIYEKKKDSGNFALYVEKKPSIPGQYQVILYHKVSGIISKGVLTEKLYNLFFHPELYKKEHDPKTR